MSAWCRGTAAPRASWEAHDLRRPHILQRRRLARDRCNQAALPHPCWHSVPVATHSARVSCCCRRYAGATVPHRPQTLHTAPPQPGARIWADCRHHCLAPEAHSLGGGQAVPRSTLHRHATARAASCPRARLRRRDAVLHGRKRGCCCEGGAGGQCHTRPSAAGQQSGADSHATKPHRRSSAPRSTNQAQRWLRAFLRSCDPRCPVPVVGFVPALPCRRGCDVLAGDATRASAVTGA